MKFQNPYLNIKQRIETLQRWILVHSYLYYERDASIVDDLKFDSNARQLVQMMKDNKYETKSSHYYYAFKGFDGTTGFDLYVKLNGMHQRLVQRDAEYLISITKEDNVNAKKEHKVLQKK